MGNSTTVAKFSGVKTGKIKVIVYTMTGLLSAVAAIYLASKMSSVRPDVAKGYELDIIAMAVLGGVSTSGGKGRILGATLAIMVIGSWSNQCVKPNYYDSCRLATNYCGSNSEFQR